MIEHVTTEAMIADPLTKGVRPVVFKNHAENMGILSSFDVLVQWEYCLCNYAIVFYTLVFDNLYHYLYCNYGSFLFLIHVDIQVIKIMQILTYWHGNAGCLSISQDVVEEIACFVVA